MRESGVRGILIYCSTIIARIRLPSTRIDGPMTSNRAYLHRLRQARRRRAAGFQLEH
jgi:hypothetical protein